MNEQPKDHVPVGPAPPESVNTLLSKSVWVPVTTGIVSNLATKVQPWFEVSTEMADGLSAILAAVAIIFVRRITNRPAHFRKTKE